MSYKKTLAEHYFENDYLKTRDFSTPAHALIPGSSLHKVWIGNPRNQIMTFAFRSNYGKPKTDLNKHPRWNAKPPDQLERIGKDFPSYCCRYFDKQLSPLGI